MKITKENKSAVLLLFKIACCLTLPIYKIGPLLVGIPLQIFLLSILFGHWSWWLCLWLALAFLLAFLSFNVPNIYKKRLSCVRNHIANKLRLNSPIDLPFFLYLRPFNSDSSLVASVHPRRHQLGPGASSFGMSLGEFWRRRKVSYDFLGNPRVEDIEVRRYNETIEDYIESIFRPWGDLIALSNHIQRQPYVAELKNNRLPMDDDSWRTAFESLALQAQMIFFLPLIGIDISNNDDNSDKNRANSISLEGTLFELQTILKHDLLEKTYFIIPNLLDDVEYQNIVSKLREYNIYLPDTLTDLIFESAENTLDLLMKGTTYDELKLFTIVKLNSYGRLTTATAFYSVSDLEAMISKARKSISIRDKQLGPQYCKKFSNGDYFGILNQW